MPGCDLEASRLVIVHNSFMLLPALETRVG